jgi:hypothetical protein
MNVKTCFAPPVTRSCNQNSLFEYTIIRKSLNMAKKH